MATKQNDRVMTVREFAKTLGISDASAYAAAKRREIPGIIKIGHRILISRDAVEALLRGHGDIRA